MDENDSVIEKESLLRSKRVFGIATMIFGSGLVLPLLVGLVGTVFGMIRAFDQLQKSGGADPSALAGDISVALMTSMWGLVVSAVSFIPFVVFLVLYLNRRGRLICQPFNKYREDQR